MTSQRFDTIMLCCSGAQVDRSCDRYPEARVGPDGLPAAAWQYGGLSTHKTLRLVSVELAVTGEPHFAFNDQRLAFLPKGESPTDDTEVVRAGVDTRCIRGGGASSDRRAPEFATLRWAKGNGEDKRQAKRRGILTSRLCFGARRFVS